MARDASETRDVCFTNDAGQIHIPAVVQEKLRLGYNDGVKVTIETEDKDVDEVSFTRYVTAASTITVPVSIRRRFDFGDVVGVSFEATGERWTPEVDNTARKAVYEAAHETERTLEAVTDIIADD